MKKALFLWFTLLVGCSSGPVPKGILKAGQMRKVVYDLMQVEEYVTNFAVKDSAIDIKKQRSIFYEQVFKLHNTSRKEFYTSYTYYQQHPDLQKVLYDSLYNQANKRKPVPSRILPMKSAKVKQRVF